VEGGGCMDGWAAVVVAAVAVGLALSARDPCTNKREHTHRWRGGCVHGWVVVVVAAISLALVHTTNV